MSPFGVAKYILTSALFVVSLFFALRLLFAHDMRRDAWRSTVKRYVYISRAKFKVWSILLGWILLFVALSVAYFQIDQIITNQ
jgi:4-amino-4-deoxy-L-arabinose transferase-like glycosyltransferase